MKRSAIIAAVLVTVVACGRRMHEERDAFRWEDRLPAGGTLHLRNTDGGIEVVAADDSVARVVGSKRWTQGRSDAVRFMWTRAGDDAYVCAVWGRNGQCDAQRYRSSPQRRSWLDMLSLFSHGSDAVANLTVELPPGVRVDASTVTGPVRIEGATAGVTARTTNGSIAIDNSAGTTDARTTNGSIRASLDSLGDEEPLRLESVNGSVTAEVPPDVEGEIRLSTVNGRAHTDFPIVSTGRNSSRSVRGRIGSSSRAIDLRSINGGVVLRKRDSSAEPDPGAEPDEPAPPPTPRPRRRPRG